MRVHAFVEDDVARFAKELRLVHSGVGVAQKIFGALVADVRKRNADAGGCEGFVAVQAEWLRHLLLYAFGDLNRFVLIAQAVEQYGEFIAAQPRHFIDRAYAMAQALGNADQQLIAD